MKDFMNIDRRKKNLEYVSAHFGLQEKHAEAVMDVVTKTMEDMKKRGFNYIQTEAVKDMLDSEIKWELCLGSKKLDGAND